MNFEIHKVYHVYNRGNQRQIIFFDDNDYLLFIRKMREQILPVSNLLAWCLMPNHFHLMIHVTEKGCQNRISGTNEISELSYRLGILLSSYTTTTVINNSRGISGSLFQKRTKSKLIHDQEYMVRCMHYIHQNPFVAGLSENKLEHWKYSSFPDYAGFRKGSLCNKNLLFELTDYDAHNFMKDSYDVLGGDVVKLFY